MFKKRHDELHRFLEWRKQTRFIRHYGGPIMALGLFAVCLCFVWRSRPIRAPANQNLIEAREETRQPKPPDPFLQASQSLRHASGLAR